MARCTDISNSISFHAMGKNIFISFLDYVSFGRERNYQTWTATDDCEK
jgi:hypothetical protein